MSRQDSASFGSVADLQQARYLSYSQFAIAFDRTVEAVKKQVHAGALPTVTVAGKPYIDLQRLYAQLNTPANPVETTVDPKGAGEVTATPVKDKTLEQQAKDLVVRHLGRKEESRATR